VQEALKNGKAFAGGFFQDAEFAERAGDGAVFS
jgi:hypothetical protein